MKQDKEVWLRGEIVDGVTPLLQPVAHAMLQAQEEINTLMEDFPDELLWNQPAGCAPPAFHLLHIAGVLDRLLCYAAGKSLTDAQLQYLKQESVPAATTVKHLLQHFNNQVIITIERLKQFTVQDLASYRGVGRAALPSTVIGLCTHAAEHTMRHTGQLLVTVKVLTQLITGRQSS
ncbi:DinB family protein [Niabella aquatica]